MIAAVPLAKFLRALLVGDALLAVCILEQFDFLLDRFGPDLLERGVTAFQRGIFALGNQCAGKRGEGRLRGPGIGERGLHRVDARITEFLEHGNEFIPCLRRIVGVETDLAEEILVVDVAGGIARERQAVQSLLRRVRGLHEVLRDVHHALVEFAHQRVIGEIMEHPGGGEGAEAVVAVEGNHVGHAVLHETRAQVGLRIRRVVDV